MRGSSGRFSVTPKILPGTRDLSHRTLLRAVLVSVAVCGAACAQDFLPPGSDEDEARAALAERMTRAIIGRTPVSDARVIEAIATVPRHEFVPKPHRANAYEDRPLPIGHDQTISQPYVVARMTEALDLDPSDVVLEIGTGSGYQAAVLAELCGQVYTIEIVPELGETARRRLAELGYDNVAVRVGDGYQGWPEHAPFDAIIVTAAPESVPQPLIDQLKPGGRLVIPVGPQSGAQQLLLVRKDSDGNITRESLELVRFVPMTGEAQER